MRPSRRNGSAIASNAVKRGLRLPSASWNTIWMRLRSLSRAKLRAGMPPISSWAKRMVPEVGSISLVTRRTRVDLPQPLSPTMASVLPCSAVSSTLLSAPIERPVSYMESPAVTTRDATNLAGDLWFEVKRKPNEVLVALRPMTRAGIRVTKPLLTSVDLGVRLNPMDLAEVLVRARQDKLFEPDAVRRFAKTQ